MYIKHTAIAAATLLASSVAFSFVDETQGPYVGGNLGWSKTHLEFVDADEQNNTGFAWGLTGGYKFNQHFAVELDYVRMAESKYPYDFTISGIKFAGDAISKNQFIGLTAKGIMPIEDTFNLFVKVGAAYVNHELALTGKVSQGGQSVPVALEPEKLNRVAPLLGVGVGIPVSENVELTLQGMTTTKVGEVPAMTMVSGGLLFHFGA